MARLLIIAIGNPLRSDDGLAWRAAEALAALNFASGIDIVTRQQLTPELAQAASQAQRVLFLDAAAVSGIPGEIASSLVHPQSPASAFTHQVSPAEILGLAAELYGQSPEATMISMCGECFDHGESLSARVTESLPTLIARVEEWVEQAAGPTPLSQRE